MNLCDASLHPSCVVGARQTLRQLTQIADAQVHLATSAGDARQGLENLGVLRRLLVELAVEVPGLVGVGQLLRQHPALFAQQVLLEGVALSALGDGRQRRKGVRPSLGQFQVPSATQGRPATDTRLARSGLKSAPSGDPAPPWRRRPDSNR